MPMPVKLTAEQINAIIAGEELARHGYPPPAQHGPLRFYDKELQCLHTGYYVGGILFDEPDKGGARRACRTPTNWKLQGMPICSTHALARMNQLLHKMGVG